MATLDFCLETQCAKCKAVRAHILDKNDVEPVDWPDLCRVVMGSIGFTVAALQLPQLGRCSSDDGPLVARLRGVTRSGFAPGLDGLLSFYDPDGAEYGTPVPPIPFPTDEAYNLMFPNALNIQAREQGQSENPGLLLRAGVPSGDRSTATHNTFGRESLQ